MEGSLLSKFSLGTSNVQERHRGVLDAFSPTYVMMLGKKLFVSDIDGTLLKTGQAPHPEVIRAIGDFQKEGGLFALCTGRSLPAVQGMIRLLPDCAPCILCSGAVIYDFQEERLLFSQQLDPEIYCSLEAIMKKEPSISVTISADDKIFRIHDNDIFLKRGVYEDRTAPQASLNRVASAVKVLFTCDNPWLLEKTVDLYVDPEKFQIHRSSTHFYELTAAGVSKATGIQQLNKLLGGQRIYSAGDAPSDVVMASVSELFFAPETAMESVCGASGFLFPDPQAGGLAWALDYVRMQK